MVSRAEADQAMDQLRYKVSLENQDIVVYQHIEEPGVRVALDFSFETISRCAIEEQLIANEIDVNAFFAYLDQ